MSQKSNSHDGSNTHSVQGKLSDLPIVCEPTDEVVRGFGLGRVGRDRGGVPRSGVVRSTVDQRAVAVSRRAGVPARLRRARHKLLNPGPAPRVGPVTQVSREASMSRSLPASHQYRISSEPGICVTRTFSFFWRQSPTGAPVRIAATLTFTASTVGAWNVLLSLKRSTRKPPGWRPNAHRPSAHSFARAV